MKLLRIILALLPAALAAQTATVTKTPGTNAIKEDLAFGSSRTLTIASGGTLDVSAATLTLPARLDIPTLTGNALKTLRVNAAGDALEWSDAGAGTVSSVALSLPAIFSVSGSPVTGAGTLTALLASQSANRVFAGPTTGSAAAPTFRALVAADIPDISSTYQPLSSALSDFAQTGQFYVIAGDSLSDVSWSDSQPEIGNGNVWSELMLAYAPFSGRGTAVQTAVQARKIANLASNYATEVYPYRPGGASGPAVGKKSFLFVWIGINDIGSTSLATMKSSWTSYVSTARSDGFTVVAFTILRKSTFDSSNDSDRVAFNEHIRSSANWDYLVDVATLFPSSADTTWVYDGTHLNAAANAWLARYVASVMYSRAIPSRSPFVMPQLEVVRDATIGGILYGSSNLDANQYLVTGTRTALSGGGGNVRHRDDTGTIRWTSGILGSAAATSWSLYDNVRGQERITITSVAGSTATGTFAMNGEFTGNLAANNIVLGGTLTTAGAVTTSGGHAITLTTTGTTSVTLPTSGTLSTVGGNIGAATGTSLTLTGNLTSGGNIKLSTVGSYILGTKTGGSEVSLLRVTADTNSITRFISADDTGGFGWSDQAQSVNWMTLTSAGATIRGTITSGSGATQITDSAGKILSAALNTVAVAQGGTGLTSLGTGVVSALGNATNAANGIVTYNGSLGSATATTQSQADNSTKVATTAYVDLAMRPPAIPANITANTTLDSSHRNKWLRVNGNVTLTVNSSSFAAEDECYIEQVGAGTVILTASGTTLNKSTSNATISTRTQYSVIGLKAISSTVATVFGDVTQ